MLQQEYDKIENQICPLNARPHFSRDLAQNHLRRQGFQHLALLDCPSYCVRSIPKDESVGVLFVKARVCCNRNVSNLYKSVAKYLEEDISPLS